MALKLEIHPGPGDLDRRAGKCRTRRKRRL